MSGLFVRVILARLMAVGLLAAALAAPAQQAGARPAVDLAGRLAQAQADPALADSLLRTGRRVAAVCAHCHGEGGNSLKPEIPNLAGQNPAYLLDQIHQFSEGRRRNEFMQGILKALKPDEKVGMVLFYASQAVLPRPVSNPAQAARGRALYQQLCVSCHDAEGRGNAQLARVAGQQPLYLESTLRRYRTGSGPRTDATMASFTKPLSDADIGALVSYMAAMQ